MFLCFSFTSLPPRREQQHLLSTLHSHQKLWVILYESQLGPSHRNVISKYLPSTREGCGHYSPPLAVHKYIFFLLGMLGVLLGVKHATGDLPSPFVTDHNTVVVLIVDLFAYVGALATAKILQASNNGNMYELMNNISLLFGTLAVILLALLLDPGFGWFTLACWVVSIAIIVTKSYQNLRRLCTAAVGYVRDKMKELMMRMRGTEEPENQDGMP
ncbi:uncharacterized protein LOC126582179 isoform X2 [Malus sylvestris]|uniref:uncharacterized protein LOC126582179 isoform X2 n=1 Tax=Malus sylvestris TaxID=3752 RepID=UPI0021AD2237|nr:uncharacterized protein LOC126582179 isoform X2 [Malus sylvestris]